MDITGLGSIFDFGSKLVDKLIPDPAQKAAAQLELIKLNQSGELDMMKVQMSAILAEATSPDPWTSRSRPSFLYVMYALILASIPMGILSAWHPDISSAIAEGMKAWLAAIPEALWTVFGVGYLGYTSARSFEKSKSLTK
jgi:hypothetical protein